MAEPHPHCRVIKELVRRGGDDKYTVLQIVSWDGHAPVLEKRQYKKDEKGRIHTSRLVGLNAWEFEWLVGHFNEICEVFIQHDPTYTPRLLLETKNITKT